MAAFVPGDIVEIETARGLAYVQVTHDHPSYPQVVRAMPGLHAARPDIQALSRREAAFTAMVPLAGDGAVTLRKLAHVPVAQADRPFPRFRMEILDKIDGARDAVAYWWFWDGEGLTCDADPTPEERRLPRREVLSIGEVVERLGEGADTGSG